MLSTDVVSGVTLPNLETLNLSDNRIADWSNLEDTLAPLPSSVLGASVHVHRLTDTL